MSEHSSTFLHAINLKNPITCKYIVESGSLNSLMATSFTMNVPSNHHMLPIDELCLNADEHFKGVINPRSEILFLASMIRKLPEQKLFVDGNPVEMTASKKARLLDLSERELTFEYVRRKIAPDKPSRYTSLYLAENNLDGRLNLSNMLEFFSNPYVMEVAIIPNPFAVARVDRRWFDVYAAERNIRTVVNYWLGKSYDGAPAWEYLLEGSAVVAQNDRKYVSLYGSYQSL